jgi:hypothetical protein
VGIVLGGLLLLGLLGLLPRGIVRLDVWLFAALAAGAVYARLL